MPIFHYSGQNLSKVEKTTFSSEGMYERADLQAALKRNISAISDELLIIGEEFSGWSHGQRRIDLLAIDKQANIVVIELKRNDSGDYMELQAIRYAAMISLLTWEEAIKVFDEYLQKEYPDKTKRAEQELLDFLGWLRPMEDDFGVETHILLVSADFSTELTASVIWLNKSGLNIKCVQINPYKFEGNIFINIQQIIPLPETEDYQIQVRRKDEEKKTTRQSGKDYTKYRFKGEVYNKGRLVIAVVKDWVESNNPQGIEELRKAFPQGIASNGTFASIDEANPVRYFTNSSERIDFNDGTCYVISSQWGGERHRNFVKIAQDLGCDIEESS